MNSYITFLTIFCIYLIINFERSSCKSIDGINDLEETSTRRLVAGIPYGSISGRLAEYFATERITHHHSPSFQDTFVDHDTNVQDIIF
ncbi:hypothetical protein O3M35_003240 [Rhynocoris fuscipes]|uniref:Uncharacterized protein n=1 Tax=Rhynocoris fuscipes TaxID=488301 RepID=A0AAW1CMB9_9HEMI